MRRRWTSWRLAQDREQLKVVWNEHKRLGLDHQLATLVEQFGGANERNVKGIAIREQKS